MESFSEGMASLSPATSNVNDGFFDQIVRVERTFEFTPEAAEPYRPTLSPKPVIVARCTRRRARALEFPGASYYKRSWD